MKVKVLICDDEADLRRLFRLHLTGEHDIELIGEACNGAEAIELTTQLGPDVLLLDIHMPVMDGFEALAEISLSRPETKVIMLSGFDEDRCGNKAEELGAIDYIEKGMDLRAVAERIRTAAVV